MSEEDAVSTSSSYNEATTSSVDSFDNSSILQISCENRVPTQNWNFRQNSENFHRCPSQGTMSHDNYNSQPASVNIRRQMLLNRVLLVEAANQRQNQSEAYEELKRLIIFAGIFFLFIIVFVLLKFQVSLDDVFKWSPVVWLVGVIICGFVMNIFIQMKKYIRKRKAKRLREQQNLLYSLNLPSSFHCFAPSTQLESCCQCGGSLLTNQCQNSNAILMDGNDNVRLPFILNRNDSILSLNAFFGTERPAPSNYTIPSYEQVMSGAKTWLLSKSNINFTTSHTTQQPPTYSMGINPPQSNSTFNGSNEPENIGLIASSSRSNEQSRLSDDVPPPAYDESISLPVTVLAQEGRPQQIMNIILPEHNSSVRSIEIFNSFL